MPDLVDTSILIRHLRGDERATDLLNKLCDLIVAIVAITARRVTMELREYLRCFPFGERPLTKQNLSKLYVSRSETEEQFFSQLVENRLLYLSGERGVGKTTFVARVESANGNIIRLFLYPLGAKEDLFEQILTLLKIPKLDGGPLTIQEMAHVLIDRGEFLSEKIVFFDGPPEMNEGKELLAMLYALAELLVSQIDLRVVIVGSEVVHRAELGELASVKLRPFTMAENDELLQKRISSVIREGKTVGELFSDTFFHAIHRISGGNPEKSIYVMNSILKQYWMKEITSPLNSGEVYATIIKEISEKLDSLDFAILRVFVGQLESKDSLTSDEINSLMDKKIPPRTLREKLRLLCERKILERKGLGRKRYYTLLRIPYEVLS